MNKEKVDVLLYRDDPALESMVRTGYHCCIVNPFCTNRHTHDFYEITYCISGNAVHLINHQELPVSNGTVIIMRPDETHHFKHYSNANALTVCITPTEFHSFLKVYNLENCKYFVDPPQRTDLPPHLKASAFDSIYLMHLCENIIASATPDASPCLKLLLGHVLSMIILQDTSTENDMPKYFQHALTQINQLENAKGGVQRFLALTNLSHSQLCRMTKKYLDTTPHEYINSIRMKWAYSLVTNTNIDIESIADSVGFSSYSHFHKLFKETFHITPGELR